MRSRKHSFGAAAAAAACLWLLVIMARPCFAQVDTYLSQCRVDPWSPKDGLPNRIISAVSQSPDGYIWIGTDAGLIRFDGDKFTRFDTTNTPGLTSNLITTLAVSPTGALWVGTESGGFGTFENGAFHCISAQEKGWGKTTAFLFDRDGSVWVGCNGHILLYHVVDGKVVLRYNDPNGHVNVITGIARLDDGDLVFAIPGEGLYRWLPSGRRMPYKDTRTLPSTAIWAVAYRHGSGLWCATDNSGLIDVHDDGVVRHYTVANGLPSNNVYCLQPYNGDLWAGTANGIAHVVDDARGTEGPTNISGGRITHFGRLEGLPGSAVHVMAVDMEHGLWAVAGNSLTRFGRTLLAPIHVAIGSELATIDTLATKFTSDGVWCATDHGLYTITPSGEPIAYPGVDGNVEAAAQTSDGTLWVVRVLDHDRRVLEGRRGTGIRRYELLPQYNMMAASGRFVYVLTSEHLFRPNGAHLDDLGPIDSNGWIFCSKIDRDGNVWIGSNNGLIEKSGKQQKHIDLGDPTLHALSMDFDADGTLWIGSDKGIVRYAHGAATLYAGIPNPACFELRCDNNGKIWSAFRNGLAAVAKSDLDRIDRHEIITPPVERFDASDGIASMPIQYAAAKSNDGKLWFAGDLSVTMVDPSHATSMAAVAKVALTCVVVDGHVLAGGINRLPPGGGKLEIQYAALSYVAPEKIRFRYRLLGFDKGWSEPTANRNAVYANLPPGRYVFQVTACNAEGVWNPTPTSIRFILTPHFYQTVWFAALVAVFALGIIACALRFRTRHLEVRARDLELAVNNRTNELLTANEQLVKAQKELEEQHENLAAIHEELQAQNEELIETKVDLEFANNRLHDLAATDGLTGLKNHRAFQEQLSHEWSRRERTGAPLSIILMDVDHFKAYNDAYGHPAGDKVLMLIGGILTENARKSDIVARYGGEEFVIIAPETDADAALRLGERLRAEVEAHDWTVHGITGSFGVATATPDSTPTDLVSAADIALYRSKQAGRNRVTLAFTTEIGKAAA